MAVEIKELVIRAVVDYPSQQGKDATEANEPANSQGQPDIVEACVKQVMKILKQKQQR